MVKADLIHIPKPDSKKDSTKGPQRQDAIKTDD
jgi:hypothetical protein